MTEALDSLNEWNKAWRKSKNFTFRHAAAWVRLKYGRSCPFHNPDNINIQYSYKLEAEQMGLEWKPEEICEDFNIIREQVELSTFKEVEKRRVEKILEIKKQMLIEQAKFKEELRKTKEDENKNVVAYEALYLNLYPPGDARVPKLMCGEWKKNPKRYISTEGPHPDAKYWETKQQWAGDAPNLTISYFE